MSMDPVPLVRAIFQFKSGKSVGSVRESVGCGHVVGSYVFFPTGIESIGDVVPLVVSVEYFLLVVSVNYFQLVESDNYFQLVESQN